MRIEHLAIWTYNLEGLKNFYMQYFDASASGGYYNHTREFRSYFLSFNGDCRLEIMEMPNISKSKNDPLKQYTGITHFALKVGSVQRVNELTEELGKDGFKIVGQPRITGDGFYESVFLDPDGNRVELVA